MKKDKKKTIITCIILLILMTLFLFGVSYFVLFGNGINKNKSGDKNITVDKGSSYINNRVIIFFKDDVSKSKQKEIIKRIGGKVISKSSLEDAYIVRLKKRYTTLSSSERYCNKLKKKYKEIDNVFFEMVNRIEYNKNSGWGN